LTLSHAHVKMISTMQETPVRFSGLSDEEYRSQFHH
jgi:hypothetical protein